MRVSSPFFALGFFLVSALGAPTALHAIETFNGETTGRHIVTLKQGIAKEGLINQIKQNVTITHEFDIINGFAGELDEETLNALRANPDVEIIAEDGIMHTMVTQSVHKFLFP
jgi:cerevisin